MLKKLFVSLVFVFATAIPAQANEIYTQVEADYTLGASEAAKVKLDYTLTNRSPTVYVSQYQLVIPDIGVSGIVFQPGEQKVNKQEHQDHDRYIIDLEFTNEVVGQGKSRQFGLEYTDRHLLKRRGQAQVINIDTLPNRQDFDEYKLIVRVPQHFGTPDLISPMPVKTGTGSGQLVYTFDGRETSQITIGYGQEQILKYNLNYHLFNPDNAPAYQVVSFPGDNQDLQFIMTSLNHQPNSWRPQADGSWQGIYLLSAGQELEIEADGYVIDKIIDRDFRIADYYPQLNSQFSAFNVDALAPEDLQTSQQEIIFTTDVGHQGALLRLDQLILTLNNQTGYSHDDYTLEITDIRGNVNISVPTSLQLRPWQKSVIIAPIKPQRWWQPYAPFSARVNIYDSQKQLVTSSHVTGVGFSWAAFAALGGLGGLAAIAGSLLVARRQPKDHLRR